MLRRVRYRKHPPAEPGALKVGPLEAASGALRGPSMTTGMPGGRGVFQPPYQIQVLVRRRSAVACLESSSDDSRDSGDHADAKRTERQHGAFVLMGEIVEPWTPGRFTTGVDPRHEPSGQPPTASSACSCRALPPPKSPPPANCCSMGDGEAGETAVIRLAGRAAAAQTINLRAPVCSPTRGPFPGPRSGPQPSRRA